MKNLEYHVAVNRIAIALAISAIALLGDNDDDD